MRFWAVLVLAGCMGELPGELLPRGSGAPTLLPRLDLDAGRDAGLDAGHDAGFDAGFDAGTFVDAGCLPEVPLVVTLDARGPTRAYAYATVDGRDVALLVDTGSQHTFLTVLDGGPDGAPAGSVGLGCEQRPVIGRPYSINESGPAGRPVVGILGADWFLERERELDLAGRAARTPATPVPAGWSRLQYENIYGYLFVRVQLDGHDVRLGFDTGAPHTLWLGQDGGPTDEPWHTQDAYGNPLVFWLGTAALAAPGHATRTIPVLRAQRFPSFEDSNRLLDAGAIHGLYGLTTMGNRRLRIDAATSSIWFAP